MTWLDSGHDLILANDTGPYGVAERSVLPMKPGNSGGGKGPQSKTDARSSEGHGD